MSRNVVLAPIAAHTHTLIFLHGLGDSANGGWKQVAEEWREQFKGLKIVLPQAPTRPVTLNFGMPMPSWHDICSLSAIDNETFKGLDESIETVRRIIEEESAHVPSNKIFVGGFSQGGALSLMTGLQSSKPLCGLISLSGYLPVRLDSDVSSLLSGAGRTVPLLMCHGESDEVVQFAIGRRSMEKIRAERPVEWKTYRGMAHHSCEEEMRDMSNFIKKHL